MADPVTIAQTGVDPITGSYLSAERRKAIFRSTRVSGFGGGGNGGNVQPQTSAIVKRQSDDIVQLRKEINTLRKTQTESITTFQQTITGIQSFLGVIGVNVKDLGRGISGVNNLLTADSNLEIKKERQEQAQEKKLSEQGARAGKEKLLEQKIQNALLVPVKAVMNRTKGIFDGLMKAYTFLFFGWLSNRIIDTLRAQSGKTTNIFKSIFDAVGDGIVFFLKSLVVINKSFAGIIGIVTGVTKTLAKFISSSVKILFEGIGRITKTIFDTEKILGKEGLEAGGKIVAKESEEEILKILGKTGGKVVDKEAAKVAGKLLGKFSTEEILKTIVKFGGKRIPFAGIAIGAGFASYRLYKGQPIPALFELLSGILGPFGIPIDIGLGIWDYFQENDETEKSQSSSTPVSAAIPQSRVVQPESTPTNNQTINPKTSLVPLAQNLNINANTSGSNQMSETDFNIPPEYGEIKAPPEQEVTGNIKAELRPAQTQRVAIPVARVGPEPEQRPNIIMMSSLTPQTQASSTVLQSTGETPASDVPAIPSSNPNNFYTLYSQINYNVVI